MQKKYCFIISFICVVFAISLQASISNADISGIDEKLYLQKVQFGSVGLCKKLCFKRYGSYVSYKYKACMRYHCQKGYNDHHCEKQEHKCTKHYKKHSKKFDHCMKKHDC